MSPSLKTPKKKRSVIRFLWRALCAVGVLTLAGVIWLAAGGPVYIDRWLDVTQPPVRAEAIVVLGGGTNGDNLPLPQGWERISAAARLYADGFAPVVIFSGGGTSSVSESEVYANAAAWLGIPREAMVFEPKAQSTADHGRALLGLMLPRGNAIGTDTPLLVATSAFHSRRALLSFSRAGFTHVRVVSRYVLNPAARVVNRAPASAAPLPSGSPLALTNTVTGYQPSGKRYDDVLFRLAYRAFDFFIGLREVGAVLLS
ncbi:MAG TPA: YdcF family protein [Vicinamibacterales bacterium]|nr:YdcF family protein [Vicinamibacterales bacterium]